jgi:hypothetical protein
MEGEMSSPSAEERAPKRAKLAPKLAADLQSPLKSSPASSASELGEQVAWSPLNDQRMELELERPFNADTVQRTHLVLQSVPGGATLVRTVHASLDAATRRVLRSKTCEDCSEYAPSSYEDAVRAAQLKAEAAQQSGYRLVTQPNAATPEPMDDSKEAMGGQQRVHFSERVRVMLIEKTGTRKVRGGAKKRSGGAPPRSPKKAGRATLTAATAQEPASAPSCGSGTAAGALPEVAPF